MCCGPIPQIYPYFSSVGVPCDASVNPADFIVDLTHSPEAGDEEDEEDEAVCVLGIPTRRSCRTPSPLLNQS